MKAVRGAGFFLVLILVWALLAHQKLWDSTLLPSPGSVWGSLQDLARNASLADQIAASLRRVLLGYGYSLALGIPIGAALGRYAWIDETLGALVAGLQSLPSVCWLPLAVLWFGLSDSAIVFVVVMGSLVSIAVAVRDGLRNLPPIYVRAARTLGASRWSLLLRVLLPASLPSILTGAKLGWSYAWRSLMSGELIFSTFGLGHALMVGRELGDISQVLAVMAVIVALGLLAENLVFGRLEAHVRRRWGLDLA